MLRYIIAVGNPASVSDCEQIKDLRGRIQICSVDWKSPMAAPGIYVAYVDHANAPNSAIPLPDNRGVILGSLYKSPERGRGNPPTIVPSIPRIDSDVIIQSKGRSMVRDFWGYYVAALFYPEDCCCFVMRSPASPLACFQVNVGSLTLFFSHLDDFVALDLLPLSINWDCVAAQVAGGDFLTSETAINEITSVECGECVECRPEQRFKHTYWDPRSFLDKRSIENFSDAAQMVRVCTEFCVNALASPHRNILVTLSGGLDSSIVMSSLSRCPHKPSISAVNYSSRGTGDERRFARSMAHAVDCKLVERVRNQSLDLRRVEECNRTARPVLNFSAPDTEARNIDLARDLRATAIFNGELGDNIFGSRPGPEVLVECLRRFGFGRRYLSVAIDLAILKRQSLWRTLSAAHREWRSVARSPDFDSLAEVRRLYGEARVRSLILASPETEELCRAMGNRFIHPWLRESRRMAPGSHTLLFGLIAVTSTSYHSPFSKPSDPPFISPLVSQPLVELALRIPAYLHCERAQDRPVARAAFADVLPVDILQRGLGKGGPILWAKDVVEKNAEFLRDYLLGGILVDRKLLDRRKLEVVLSPRIAKSTVIVGDILAKLYIEAWLRKWTSPQRSVA
jgi:asparagine synthase (glutamine-hydrolysing)